MISTKDSPGPFDGMARALPGEPVFTLRAHDVSAPTLVHAWVRRRRRDILSAGLPDEKRELELRQCTDAEEIAFAMVEWRAGLEPAEPDSPKASRPFYSGHVMDPAEAFAQTRWTETNQAAQLIHNAISDLSDAAQLLALHGHDVSEISRAMADMQSLASAVKPNRAGYEVTAQDRERAAAAAQDVQP